MINKISKLLILAISIGLSACATTPTVVDNKSVVDYVWPLPPEEPKIKYMETLSRSSDVEEKMSYLDKMLGEKEIVAGLMQPYSAAVNSKGKIYVVDQPLLKVFDKKNKKYVEVNALDKVRLGAPTGIAISSNDTIYISDAKLKGVFGFDEEYRLLVAMGGEDGCGESMLERPTGVAVDNANGRLYVVDTKKHHVLAYDLKGQFLFLIGERGDQLGDFNYPTNIAVDKEGTIYISDEGNFRVQIFDSMGKVIRSIGQIGTRRGDFARPKGIAVDSEEHIYVIDAAFQNFQIFNKNGRLLLFVGEGGAGPGQFSLPTGIFIDNEDRIYVVDRMNSRVQIFEYLGDKWKQRQIAQAKQKDQTKPAEKK